jgi:hypothetical protein
MTNRLRASAWFLALAAIMLRAALPAGWMPIADGMGGTRLIICTGHGPLTDGSHSRHQAPLSGVGYDVCPFAAAVHLATPAGIALLPVPAWNGRESDTAAFAQNIFLTHLPDGIHPPRAPPSFA